MKRGLLAFFAVLFVASVADAQITLTPAAPNGLPRMVFGSPYSVIVQATSIVPGPVQMNYSGSFAPGVTITRLSSDTIQISGIPFNNGRMRAQGLQVMVMDSGGNIIFAFYNVR